MMNSVTVPPASVDLSAWAPPVGDQGPVGSCTSWSTGYYYRYWLRNRATGDTALFAPMYLYTQLSGGNEDMGTTFPDNINILHDQGIARQADYWQGNYDYATVPTTDESSAAYPFDGVVGTFLYSGPNSSAQSIIEASLAAGQPVVISIPVYDNFYDANSSNPLVGPPTPDMSLYGYHAVFVVKYDAAGAWIENSWGTYWGAGGWGELSWDFINGYSVEGWSMSALNDGEAGSAFDDFAFDTPDSAPSGWLLRGTTGMTPTVGFLDSSYSQAYQALAFPEVPSQYWDKWALKDGLTESTPYDVTTEMEFSTTTADRAGVVIGWKDDTWDRIDIQPNVYWGDIEFRATKGGQPLAGVTVTGAATQQHALQILPNTHYWMRVQARTHADGSGEIDVLWSTDDISFSSVLTATGAALDRNTLSGMVGVSTSGPHMPPAWFDNFTVKTWAVDLTADSGSAMEGSGVTLTAHANMDVGPTPYYIEIFHDGTLLGYCGSGSICSLPRLSDPAGYETYVAAVGYRDTAPIVVSDPAEVYWSPGYPAKPAAPTAVRGNASAAVTWTAPADNGSSIYEYVVTASSGGRNCLWTSGPLTCTVTGLTNGTPYTFTVTAVNGMGTGPTSGPSNSVTPATTPGAPTAVKAARGNASATVSWTAPASNGGSAITGYTATSSPGGKTCTASGALSCSVTGLTDGLGYTFTVKARNAVGTGPASAASASVTPLPMSTFHPITPVRLLDTRVGNGHSGLLVANTPVTFLIAGRAGLPGAISAVTGNLTVADSTAGWAIYLGPTANSAPSTSTLNFGAGQVAANGVTLALSPTGTLSATYMGPGGATTDLIFDVTGYFTSGSGGDTYHPMSPVRELDTRIGNGLSGKIKANTPACVSIAGRNGVPLAAKAVTGNVTVVAPTAAWALYLGPVMTAAPSTSAVNFNAGQIAGNNLTAALDSSGRLCATFMGPAGATTDLVFDVTGYYTADASGASFVPLTPARLLDTRVGNGLANKFTAGTPRTLIVAGRGGVPSGASAVTGNITVVDETAGWAVFVGPDPVAAPTTSTINFLVGDVKGNGLTVALSPTGTLSATYISNGGNTTDLIFDVTGYFVK